MLPSEGSCLAGSQRPAEAADVGQHLVEPLALDELHGVVVDAVALADAEDRHDVGVVQPPGRLGLAAEAGQVRRVQQRRGRQHLEGDVPAERFLLRLVNDAHAAPAHLTQDAIVAQALQVGEGGCRRPLEAVGGIGGVGGWLQVLDLHQRRKQIADVGGEVGVAVGVLAQGRVLAAGGGVRRTPRPAAPAPHRGTNGTRTWHSSGTFSRRTRARRRESP